VASATAPGEPVHGTVVLVHAGELARDSLFTVPAGSPIAQRTPAREGTPGTDVTGGPIPPRTAVVADLEAGDGARIEDMGDGRLVAHSTVDGQPKLASGRIGVDSVVRAREIPTATELVVHGTLVVQGDVGEGSRISASDHVVIGGMVARSSIVAERGVTVNGACLGSHLVVGARQAACRRVRDALRGPHRELCDLEAALGQLLAGSATAGGVGTQRAALGLLVQRRFPKLAAAWAAVVEPLEADAHAAGVPGERVAQAQRLAAALRPDARDDAPDRHELLTLRARFGEELARLDAIPDDGADVRLGHAQACRVEATGSLTITGPGTYNTDVVVDGDMSVESAGATVRGGTIGVGGRLCVGEIGAPGGARVTVTLAGPAGRTVCMEAGIAHPGHRDQELAAEIHHWPPAVQDRPRSPRVQEGAGASGAENSS
ncbi:MAG TPA: FapA family protein, partial [Miltoncostaeaceae bacterium]|nr:FapA family protein [Miltoncostaeaceae bacterium]